MCSSDLLSDGQSPDISRSESPIDDSFAATASARPFSPTESESEMELISPELTSPALANSALSHHRRISLQDGPVPARRPRDSSLPQTSDAESSTGSIARSKIVRRPQAATRKRTGRDDGTTTPPPRREISKEHRRSVSAFLEDSPGSVSRRGSKRKSRPVVNAEGDEYDVGDLVDEYE